MDEIEYTIKDMRRYEANRGLFITDMQPIVTAICVFENGDWMGVSQWDGEPYWVVDCAFRANGYPVFSNGTGSRVTGGRTFPWREALDTALENL